MAMSSPASIRTTWPKRPRRKSRRMTFRSLDGHFRLGGEAEFPWDARSGVWYILQTPSKRGLRQKGFRATLGEKWSLLEALHKAAPGRAQLLGVWTGQWETHLFVLNIELATKHLERSLGWKEAVPSVG